MARPLTLRVRIPPVLHPLLRSTRRRQELIVPYDGTSSLGHVITTLGLPLTEVGALEVGGRPVPPGHRPADGDVVEVHPVRRPQSAPPRWLLDVHLGTLARRMRLLGLDTAYSNHAADDELVERSLAEDRVLLSQDRGLLMRRALRHAAFVRGAKPAEQLDDVLDRFAPTLAPLTRCPACNGGLEDVAKAEIADRLQPGTRRTYDEFRRCGDCGRVYWRGAHAERLGAIVDAAARRSPAGRPAQ